MNIWQISAVLLAAYLLGAIPFGVIAAKICGVDIFKVGSGSIGTTNVIRACGKWWGLTVFILDVTKGAIAVKLGMLFLHDPWLVVACGALALIGHSASVFIKFRGGKSAASGLGILLMLGGWQLFLGAAILTLFVRQASGYQSVASLLSGLVTAVLFFVLPYPLAYRIFALAAVAFIWIKHIPNIKRLFNGTETKITGRKNG